MGRTIKVTGKGSISLRPDLIRLTMNLQGVQATYEKTMEKSAEEVNQLRNVFLGLGFTEKDLKTVSFHVNTKYESYQDENRVWKNRFEGYEYHHSLKIEFAADNDLLGKVLYALANSSVTPEFQIVYTIKDKEAAKNLLLGKAVADSKEKAKVLAEAAGVSLGSIQLIDYSWGEVDFVSTPMNRNMAAPRMLGAVAMKAESYDMAIEPDDVKVSDTVTVVWEIR